MEGMEQKVRRALITGVAGQDGSYLAELLLLEDPSKAHDKLGWATKTSFGGLVDLMVDADWELARQARKTTQSKAA